MSAGVSQAKPIAGGEVWETPFKFHIEPKSSSTWNWEREGKFDVIYSHSDRGRKEFSRRRNHEFKGTKIPFT